MYRLILSVKEHNELFEINDLLCILRQLEINNYKININFNTASIIIDFYDGIDDCINKILINYLIGLGTLTLFKK